MPDISMAMATAAEAASGAEDEEDEAFVIKSPLVGTFYAAPAQDAEPFVKIGDRVKKGQVLAIVEAMKMMNEIESDCDGTVADILVDNGAPVEFGQPLFKIN
jgi:acetyl-CoA carboxylase biotin carboxyl carrier protein